MQYEYISLPLVLLPFGRKIIRTKPGTKDLDKKATYYSTSPLKTSH
jgi:hypothetical protein